MTENPNQIAGEHLPPHIIISYLDGLPEKYFEDFLSSISSKKLKIHTIQREKFSIQASLEWLAPTAIFVVLTRSYFEAFLSEMGRDHYEILRKQINKLINKTREIKITRISSKGKIGTEETYSSACSILAESKAGYQLKLLIKNNISSDECSDAIQLFLKFLFNDYDETQPPNQTALQLEEAPSIGRTVLIAYDATSQTLRFVNPNPDRGWPNKQKNAD